MDAIWSFLTSTQFAAYGAGLLVVLLILCAADLLGLEWPSVNVGKKAGSQKPAANANSRSAT
jgi:hypothetical protein